MRRQEYANSYVVTDISFRPGDEYIEFNGGSVVDIDSPSGAFRDEVRRQQIRTTIEQHLDRERALARRGEHIKVLSLIFLDRVANYRLYRDDGASPGRFASWFEHDYTELAAKRKYRDLNLPAASDVHDGYFSKDTQGKLKNTRGESAADRDTYDPHHAGQGAVAQSRRACPLRLHALRSTRGMGTTPMSSRSAR